MELILMNACSGCVELYLKVELEHMKEEVMPQRLCRYVGFMPGICLPGFDEGVRCGGRICSRMQ